jgi:hypothetical protein
MIRPGLVSGSEPAGAAASKLPVGSSAAHGASRVDASTTSAAASPREVAPSPRDAALTPAPGSPAAACSLTDAAAAADKTSTPVRTLWAGETLAVDAAAVVASPVGGSRVSRDLHSASPKRPLSATGQTAAATATPGERGLEAGHLNSNPAVGGMMQRTPAPEGPTKDVVGL